MINTKFKVSNLDYKDINDFILKSKYSNYMQCPNWANYRKNKGYFEIAIYDSEKLIIYGVAYTLFKYGKKYLYFPRGPILDYTDENLIRIFVLEIKKYIINNDYDSVLIDPAITTNITGFKIKNSNIYSDQQYSSQNAIVRLEKYNDKELLNLFESKARCYIRKALASNIKIVISKDVFDLNYFLKLYNENAKVRNFPHKTLNELLNFININNVLFVYTKLNNKILNMSICIRHNDCLYYVFGANNKEKDLYHGSYLLHYKTMLYAINENIKCYDLGGVFCKIEDCNNKEFGLLRFKKMFCKTFTNYIGELEIE